MLSLEVRELSNKIDKTEKYFVTEKSRIRQEKMEKEKLQSMLFNYFYGEFKKKQEKPAEIYDNLSFINERERIINILSKSNSLSLQFLNSIYSKVLKEVYAIFKNNLKFIEAQDKKYIIEDLCIILNKVNNQKKIDTIISRKLREQLEQNGNFEIAVKMGYNPNKIYNENEINELTQKIELLNKQVKQEKKENTLKTILYISEHLLTFLFNPIVLIIIFLVWSYFYFAVPILYN